MKASHHFQKISGGISLLILALGFSLIGLLSLIRPPLSGDALASSAMGCSIGGWASMAVASVFLFAAFVYWSRYSWLTAQFAGFPLKSYKKSSRSYRSQIAGSGSRTNKTYACYQR
jgi:hypothetical protein